MAAQVESRGAFVPPLRRVRNLEEKAVFVRGLAEEVVRRCAAENALVSFDLCAYLVDLLVMGLPGICPQDDSAEGLIRTCVSYLKEEPLFVKTIKLQVNWRGKYQSRDEIRKVHHERIFGNVLPIMSEITEISSVDKEHFYRKIAIFVIMFAGLGSPTQQVTIKETQAALLSIFKASEMENFANLPKAAKEQQLMEFARLITGIMLFNKDCKKGGEGLDDLPLILTQGARATRERLVSFKEQLVKRIDHLVRGLSKEKTDCADVEDRAPEPPKLRDDSSQKFKSLLIYYNQLKYYTDELTRDLEKSLVTVKELVERLQANLLQLHNVVRFRVAVATVQVFPLFVQLSDVWVGMQEEVDILSEINNNFMDLSFAAKLQLTLPTPVEFGVPASEDAVPSRNDQIQHSLDFQPEIKVHSFSNLPENPQLQYKGFCAWSLAHMRGFLTPGNVAIGVLQLSNRFYSFSSAEAAGKWASNPTHCIKAVLKIMTAHPELINFLNLYADLESDFLERLTVEVEKTSKANVYVQTVLHPVESYICKDYTFSEWELKKRALKLAALTRCVTKSQQTVNRSFFRKDAATQVTPHKTTSTQTGRDGSCNPRLSPRSAWKFCLEAEDAVTATNYQHHNVKRK